MELPKSEHGHWNHTAVVSKKASTNESRKNKSSDAEISKRNMSKPDAHKSKSPKCYIKIAGSRYNGAFLVSVDPAIDDAIYKTMRETEVKLSRQLKYKIPSAGGSASPKNCLSSVFKCFTQSSNVLDFKKKFIVEEPLKKIERSSIEKHANKSAVLKPICVKPPKNIERPKGNKALTFDSTVRKLNQPEGGGDLLLHVAPPENLFQSSKLNDLIAPEQDKPPIAETILPQAAQIKEETNKVELDMNFDSNTDNLVTSIEGKSCDKVINVAERVSQDDLIKSSRKPIFCKEEVNLEEHSNSVPSDAIQAVKLPKDDVKVGDECTHVPNHIKSVEMTFGDNIGKPSLKLSVNDGIGVNTNKKEDRRKPPWNDSFTLMAEIKDNTQIVKIIYDNDGLNKESLPKGVQTRNYESAGVQTPDAFLRSMNISKTDPKYFPRTLFKDVQSQNFGRKWCKIPEALAHRDEIERTPYLVHTLCESQTRSVQVDRESEKSDNTKRNGTFYRLIGCQTDGSGNINKSEGSNTHNNHNEIPGVPNAIKKSSKKDFGMSTSAVDDFEKVLQSLCGSSYYYHSSETSNIDQYKEESGRLHYRSCSPEYTRLGSSYDRSIQTSSSNLTTTDQDGSRNRWVGKFQQSKIRDKFQESRRSTNGPFRKSRTIHSCTQSNLTFRNAMFDTSVMTSNRSPVLEALDNAKNEFLNKFKSHQNSSMLQPLHFSNTEGENAIGDGMDGSTKTHQDFPLKFDGGDGFMQHENAMSKSKKELRTFTSREMMNNSSYKSQTSYNISVGSLKSSVQNVGYKALATFQCKTPEFENTSTNFCSNKIKSRSCQNIFVSGDGDYKYNSMPGMVSNIKKREYQHFTTSGSLNNTTEGITSFETNFGRTDLNSYGRYLKDTDLSRCRHPPSEVGFSYAGEVGFGDQTTDEPTLDCLSTEATVDSSSEKCYRKEQIAVSHSHIGRAWRSPFQRTIVAIKTILRKKVVNLFGKKSDRNPLKNDANKFTANRYDKIVFIPVPLEKKNEDISKKIKHIN